MTGGFRPPWRRPRRWTRWLAVLLVVVAVGWGLWEVPTDYFLILPGITRDVSSMISVPGTRRVTQGRFLMVTVASQEANALAYLYGKMNPRADLEPRLEILGPGVDMTQYLEESRRMMDESQAVAKVAALRYLGYDARVLGSGVRIAAVLEGPAKGVLQEGDVVTAVNGRQIAFVEEMIEQVSRLPVGSEVVLRVQRDGSVRDFSLRTVPNPDHRDRSALRVAVANAPLHYQLPLDIKINADDISGPSAGLIFALEIINRLGPQGDLTDGMVIAGTGTVSPSGEVGPIGGIVQKTAAAERDGAQVFLVPMADARGAQQAARKMRVVPVNTLAQAVEFLRNLRPRSEGPSDGGIALTGLAGS